MIESHGLGSHGRGADRMRRRRAALETDAMYAVIESGGKQYRVEEGATLRVERLEAAPGTEVTLDRVLLVADGDTVTVGTPLVKGASVRATVLGHDRAKKVVVLKYKAKAHYRRKQGHRQRVTALRIDKITL